MEHIVGSWAGAPGTNKRRFFLLLSALVFTWFGTELVALTGISVALSSSYALQLRSGMFSAACGGSFVIFAASRPNWRLLLVTLGAGLGIAALLKWVVGTPAPLYFDVGIGLGLVSLVALGWSTARARGAATETAWGFLAAATTLPGFVALSTFFLAMTSALHPTTYDAHAFLASAAFGRVLCVDLARLFAAVPFLDSVSWYVYGTLPAALAFVCALQLRSGRRPTTDTIAAFVTAGVAGYSIYLLFPVAGPVHFFGELFPDAMPLSSMVSTSGGYLVSPVYRNCMPSLHTTWALLVWWHARPHGRWVRAAAGVFLLFTLMATLGFGYHYVIDLVVAVPFAVAVQAWCTRGSGIEHLRRKVLAWNVSLTLAWLVLILLGTELLQWSPALPWLLTGFTLWWSLRQERELHRVASASTEMVADGPRLSPEPSAQLLGLAAVFFTSGYAALIYEVVFAKSLALTFGSTAVASTTVLAVYMAGMALGTWAGGHLAPRLKSCVRAYAGTEAGIALWCGLSPVLLLMVQELYVVLAAGHEPGAAILTVYQAALGGLLLLVPTFLMGLTLPLLTQHFLARSGSLGRAVGLLYGVNTLGAAAGAFTAGYVLLPAMGIAASLVFAVGLNLLACAVALLLDRRASSPGLPGVPIAESAREPPELGRRQLPAEDGRFLGRVALVVLGLGGFVTFGLEVTYTNVLAVLAGTSAYAFALMLFAFLVGLGTGAATGRRLLRLMVPPALLLVGAELLLAVAVAVGVQAWDVIPRYFSSFHHYPLTRTFGAREFVRFAVCCLVMLPPAFLIGVIYPTAMECIGRANPSGKVQAMGRAAALNTAGNIAGALVAGFVMLPLLGSIHSLRLLAWLVLLLALLPLPGFVGKMRLAGLAGIGATALLLLSQPWSIDLDRVTTGANVYFVYQGYGKVVDYGESLDGGLTSVNESYDRQGVRVLTLLTNGKFEGDDSQRREVVAQSSFGIFPLLHTVARDRALVIGLGTGTTARVVADAGFAHIDVAELSSQVVRFARKYFGAVNHNVLDRAEVHPHTTDGRNFLLLAKDRFDLVTIEVTSIWFAGSASLYSQEFYGLVQDRLTPSGVLQQWLMLHHLQVGDLVSVLATVRSVFDNVWLYHSGGQGLIVACDGDCRPSRATLAGLLHPPALRTAAAAIGENGGDLLAARLLTPEGVDELLRYAAGHGIDVASLVSTDDNLLLEYSTPRGNVRDYSESLRENLQFLEQFTSASPLDGTALLPADLDSVEDY